MLPPQHKTAIAFSLIELLATIIIIVVLAALLIPGINEMLNWSRKATCISNLKQISVASAAYSADNNGAWPPGRHQVLFTTALMPYMGKIPTKKDPNFLNSPFICPAAKVAEPDGSGRSRGIYTPGDYGLSYAQNTYADLLGGSGAVLNRPSVERPSEMMLYMDYEGHYRAVISMPSERREAMEKRHKGYVNVAYVDGSVRPITFDDIPTSSSGSKPTWFWMGQGTKGTP